MIGFAALRRYMIGLKTPATFSSNQNNRDSLARVSRASRELHVFTSSRY